MADARADAVTEAVAERRALVNDAISEELPIADPEALYESSRYLLDAGGKRLRPAMLLLAAEAIADVEPLSEDYRTFPDLAERRVDVMAAAVSLEFIQTFTLIHDDIMDDDDLRRGVPAVHREWDEAAAILAGDTLYSSAFEVLCRADAPADRLVGAIHVLANTCTRICEGQTMDIAFESREDVTRDEYAEMVERKTAVLYAAAGAIPAHLLGADDETTEALHGFGRDIGRAFQIHDDVLDLTTPSETLGKQRGSDLVEGKRTLVTLHAREQGVTIEELVGADPTEAEIEAAVDRLREAGSIDFARETADDLIEQATSRLSVLPDNAAHERLDQLARYLVERQY